MEIHEQQCHRQATIAQQSFAAARQETQENMSTTTPLPWKKRTLRRILSDPSSSDNTSGIADAIKEIDSRATTIVEESPEQLLDDDKGNAHKKRLRLADANVDSPKAQETEKVRQSVVPVFLLTKTGSRVPALLSFDADNPAMSMMCGDDAPSSSSPLLLTQHDDAAQSSSAPPILQAASLRTKRNVTVRYVPGISSKMGVGADAACFRLCGHQVVSSGLPLSEFRQAVAAARKSESPPAVGDNSDGNELATDVVSESGGL